MNTKFVLAFSAVAVAFALFLAPMVAASVDAYTSSTQQSITQKQYNSQSTTGGTNTVFQKNINFGSNIFSSR